MTKKLLELHSRLFTINGRKVTKAQQTPEMMRAADIERVKAIRTTSKFTNKRMRTIEE